MSEKTVAGLTFKQWLVALNLELWARVGVGYRDLADRDWYSDWESEYTPLESALDAVEEEFGGAVYDIRD